VKGPLVVGLGPIVAAAAIIAAFPFWSGDGRPKGLLKPIDWP
jgi:hypothetical protein